MSQERGTESTILTIALNTSGRPHAGILRVLTVHRNPSVSMIDFDTSNGRSGKGPSIRQLRDSKLISIRNGKQLCTGSKDSLTTVLILTMFVHGTGESVNKRTGFPSIVGSCFQAEALLK